MGICRTLTLYIVLTHTHACTKTQMQRTSVHDYETFFFLMGLN